MKREQFYEIPPSAWVQVKVPESRADIQPEESVRQWCAQELIRAYGYRVTDLSFEHGVKIGSKNYRIDILIQRDGRPFAVVECKERKHKRHDQAVHQAISYATAQEIRCDLVLYTNGDTWLVHRLIGGHWTPVLDLPSAGASSNGNRMDDLLLTMGMVEPILAQLDEAIAGNDARVLLGGLQQFFNGQNLLTEHFNRKLVSATDNILRVLWVPLDDKAYRLGTFTAASGMIENFRKTTGIGSEIISDYKNVESISWYSELGGALQPLCSDANENTSPDWRLIRFIRSLLHYGRKLDQSHGNFPPIPPDVWHTLRGVLEFGFLVGLGIKLPDPLETKTESDMKNFCRSAWEQLKLDERTQ